MIDYTEAWKKIKSKKKLTWNLILSGKNILNLLKRNNLLWNRIRILELGFGYNRFLKSLVGHYSFSYMGIDISDRWIGEARMNFFEDEKIKFRKGDIAKKEKIKVKQLIIVIQPIKSSINSNFFLFYKLSET